MSESFGPIFVLSWSQNRNGCERLASIEILFYSLQLPPTYEINVPETKLNDILLTAIGKEERKESVE